MHQLNILNSIFLENYNSSINFYGTFSIKFYSSRLKLIRFLVPDDRIYKYFIFCKMLMQISFSFILVLIETCYLNYIYTHGYNYNIQANFIVIFHN